MRRLRCVVRGIVQGVNFRAAARREAARLQLTGWVRNRSDGAVELEAEGDEAALLTLLAWLHHGPRSARVDKIEQEWREPEGGNGFDIRH